MSNNARVFQYMHEKGIECKLMRLINPQDHSDKMSKVQRHSTLSP